MHHTLKIYSRYRSRLLRVYIFLSSWTKVPVIGRFVRKVANLFGGNAHGANLITLKESYEIIDSAQAIALGPCSCRAVFNNCDALMHAEIMLSVDKDTFAFNPKKLDSYRMIDKEEAKAIMKSCHSQGLIHTILKCAGGYYALCNCCTCCCVPYRLLKNYGIGNALIRQKDVVNRFKNAQPHLV